jgi:hypothetical protein
MRLLALFALVAATPALADVEMFRMPSGNVECSIGSGEAPSDIDCVIFERTGAPAAPRPAGCDGPWGHRFLMRERGPVRLECGAPGGPVLGSTHDFAYGRTGEVSGISCLSSREGLECRNADGHGFFLSRARQSVF